MTNEFKKSQQPTAINDEEDIEWVSKSQLKREAKALTEFAVKLATTYAAILDQLPLSSASVKALQDYHKHKTHIARKRHSAFMGKCLRDENMDEVYRAIELLSVEQIKQKNTHEESQSMPDIVSRLVDDDELIESLINQYEMLDRQKLRQLIRNTKKATEKKHPSMCQKLIDYLHDCGVEI